MKINLMTALVGTLISGVIFAKDCPPNTELIYRWEWRNVTKCTDQVRYEHYTNLHCKYYGVVPLTGIPANRNVTSHPAAAKSAEHYSVHKNGNICSTDFDYEKAQAYQYYDPILKMTMGAVAFYKGKIFLTEQFKRSEVDEIKERICTTRKERHRIPYCVTPAY